MCDAFILCLCIGGLDKVEKWCGFDAKKTIKKPLKILLLNIIAILQDVIETIVGISESIKH